MNIDLSQVPQLEVRQRAKVLPRYPQRKSSLISRQTPRFSGFGAED